MNKLLKAIENLYSGMLWLYPPRLRDEFGDEMRAVFSTWLADAAASGGASLLRMLLCELGGFPRAVLQAHLNTRASKIAS